MFGIITAYANCVIVIFGTIFNLFGAIVCFQHKLRKNPTFVFYGIIFVVDLISLWPVSYIHTYLSRAQIISICLSLLNF
jgi:hypothetical protein